MLYSRTEAPTEQSLLLSVLRDGQRELELRFNEEAAKLTESVAELTKTVNEKHGAAMSTAANR